MTGTKKPSTAILHYSSPPVIGGVESVIFAHCKVFLEYGMPVTVIAGKGEVESLPRGTKFIHIPEVDSNHPEIIQLGEQLQNNNVPAGFVNMVELLIKKLSPVLPSFDNLIVHNVFTKHFNIPLSIALTKLIENGYVRNCIAWCHDFTWTSEHSREKVHDGMPWDILRIYNPQIIYVTVSKQRAISLSSLLNISNGKVNVIYNGVDPRTMLGLSDDGYKLIMKLGLLNSDLNLLMPVRITEAKNIEYAICLTHELKSRLIKPKLLQTGPPDPHDIKIMKYYQSLIGLCRKFEVEDEVIFISSMIKDITGQNFIGDTTIGDLYRISDIMFMPSHREGFGMPVIEAGLVGIPVINSPNIPAAKEIGSGAFNCLAFTENPGQLADKIMVWMEHDPLHRMKRHVRQQYTWRKIFERDIQPLLLKN